MATTNLDHPMVGDILRELDRQVRADGLDQTHLAALTLQTAAACSALNLAAEHARATGNDALKDQLLGAFDTTVLAILEIRRIVHGRAV